MATDVLLIADRGDSYQVELRRLAKEQEFERVGQELRHKFEEYQQDLSCSATILLGALDESAVVLFSFWFSPPAVEDQSSVRYKLQTLVTHPGLPEQIRFSTSELAPLIFLNHWRSPSPESQTQLLAAMTSETATIVGKPGNHAMALLVSVERQQLLVVDEWESISAFELGIQADAAAQASRDKLTAWGEPFASTYRVLATWSRQKST